MVPLSWHGPCLSSLCWTLSYVLLCLHSFKWRTFFFRFGMKQAPRSHWNKNEWKCLSQRQVRGSRWLERWCCYWYDHLWRPGQRPEGFQQFGLQNKLLVLEKEERMEREFAFDRAERHLLAGDSVSCTATLSSTPTGHTEPGHTDCLWNFAKEIDVTSIIFKICFKIIMASPVSVFSSPSCIQDFSETPPKTISINLFIVYFICMGCHWCISGKVRSHLQQKVVMFKPAVVSMDSFPGEKLHISW